MDVPYNFMISLNVRTMTEVAKALKLNIEEQFNAHVWICTDMVGGMVYRDEIVKAVDKAYAVILLVNNDWAESAECEDEYNYAKRLNLTSKIEPRQPLLLPIAFPDLDWQKRGHVRLLMSSTNAIVVKEATVSSVWPQLKETLLTLNIPQAVFKKDGSIDFTKHISRDILLKFTCEQVLKWIDNHGLVPLRKHAEENFITGQDLVDLTPEDLEGFKIPPFQIKKFLMHWLNINKFQKITTEHHLILMIQLLMRRLNLLLTEKLYNYFNIQQLVYILLFQILGQVITFQVILYQKENHGVHQTLMCIQDFQRFDLILFQ